MSSNLFRLKRCLVEAHFTCQLKKNVTIYFRRKGPIETSCNFIHLDKVSSIQKIWTKYYRLRCAQYANVNGCATLFSHFKEKFKENVLVDELWLVFASDGDKERKTTHTERRQHRIARFEEKLHVVCISGENYIPWYEVLVQGFNFSRSYSI